MSDARLREAERAYKAGACSRAEWLAATDPTDVDRGALEVRIGLCLAMAARDAWGAEPCSSWRRLRADVAHDVGMYWWSYPLNVVVRAEALALSACPGEPKVDLLSVASIAHFENRPRESDRARGVLIEQFTKYVARDVASWALGERDPVKERLRSRGQHPVTA